MVSCWPRFTTRRPTMPQPYRRPRHGPKPDRRRALELLAASPDGCAEALMIAHGFTVAQMVELGRTTKEARASWSPAWRVGLAKRC